MPRTKADRLYLRIKPELKERVQKYCARNHTNVTDIVTRFFVRLLEEEKRRTKELSNPDVPQI